jgi:hypothetical protein
LAVVEEDDADGEHELPRNADRTQVERVVDRLGPRKQIVSRLDPNIHLTRLA